MMPRAAFVLLFTISCTALAQTTYHVPGDFPTPQIAIDSAADGDTIVVGPGVYVGPLIVHRAITVISSDGPDATHFIGNVVGPAVYIGRPLDPPDGPLPRVSGIRFEGFTMRTALNAGLWLLNCDAEIVNCSIRDNHSIDGYTGGVTVREADVTFDRCRILDNQGSAGRPSTLLPGFIVTNPGPGGTGGMTATGSNVRMVNCLIAENGGGDGAPSTNVHINVLSGGRGGDGAFTVIDGQLVLEHTTVANNRAGDGGSSNNPIYAGGDGFDGINGAITGVFASPVTLTDSIVWDHAGNAVQGPTTASYSCIEGGHPGMMNIAEDPQFLNGGGNYHIRSSSPCVDAGRTQSTELTDFDGHPRRRGPATDIGYDERAPIYHGTGEDFTLSSTLDGKGEDVHIKPTLGDQVLVNVLDSPNGTFVGAIPFLVIQVIVNDTVPLGVPGLPELRFDPALSAVLIDGAQLGLTLPTEGLTVGPALIPPSFLVGQTIRYQALLATPNAANGFFVASRADDIYFP